MGKRSKQETRQTDGMRSMWEFVFISQFLRVFQDKFGFVRFEPEDLENAFLEPESYPLFSIFASLLRNLSHRRDIRMATWQPAFSQELEARNIGWNPLAEGVEYSTLSPENRVLLLKRLIDFLCEKEDCSSSVEIKQFAEHFLNEELGETKPIGLDAQNYIYWYLDDLRLYREKKLKKGTQNRSWQTVCTGLAEWDSLVRSLQKSTDSQDKKLHQYLRDELLPTVTPLLKEHEKEKDLKSKKKKSKSTKSPEKEQERREVRNVLLEQEEQELQKMKQEEVGKEQMLEAEHRKKGRRRESEGDESSIPEEHQPPFLDTEFPLVTRTKRRCVVIREQTKKKKEWWDEEGLGSDNDDEDDYDSDSDGPRRKRKAKTVRPKEIPGLPNRMFIFSTALANRAAEAVSQGRVENIISFHRAQQPVSPYLRPETAQPSSKYEQQKAYYSQQQQYPMGSDPSSMSAARGFGGLPGSMVADAAVGPGRPGYSAAAQWQQYQMQQQFLKDRQQPRQGVTPVEDNIEQLLFGGNSTNGSVQAGSNGMYPRGGAGYPPRMQQPSQYGYQPQQSAGYNHYRSQYPQGQYPGYSQQNQQQQQQFFPRQRLMTTTAHSPTAQSPSTDSLGTNVRSPPPPYPTGRPADTRQQPMPHMGSSPAPIPSPTSTGSPQTPLTPHTPRFPSAVPSPSEPAKPPFSPTSQQASFPPPAGFSTQKRLSCDTNEPDTHPQPGFIELGSKTYQKALTSQAQNPYSNLNNFSQSPASALDNRSGSDDGSLHSPLESTPASYEPGPPNKSPFLPSAVSQPGMNHNVYPASSAAAAMANKSFSVESLTAPSQPAERAAHPMAAVAEPQVTPYGGLYYQTKYHPGMFGQATRYQYPQTIQHTGPFYNSQLQPTMYYDRGTLPVYPPGRDGGL